MNRRSFLAAPVVPLLAGCRAQAEALASPTEEEFTAFAPIFDEEYYTGYWETLLIGPRREVRRGIVFLSEHLLFPAAKRPSPLHIRIPDGDPKKLIKPLPLTVWRSLKEEPHRWELLTVLPNGRALHSGYAEEKLVLSRLRA